MFNCLPKLAVHPTSNEQDLCVPHLYLPVVDSTHILDSGLSVSV